MAEQQNSRIETFADLRLNATLVESLEKGGYEKPTELQKAMVGPILEGHDVVVRARRGQGKTLGYLMPVLNQIDMEQGTQAIIVSPTRELAIEISQVCRKLLGNAGLESLALHPGADADQQVNLLEKKVHVISGTPGRLLDMLERRFLNPKSVKFIVFDEVDRLLNSGHLEPMRRLMHDLAHGRQIVWVSASIDEEIELLASKYLVEPVRIDYEAAERRLAVPVHEVVFGPQREQVRVLRDRIIGVQPAASIVIASRRDDVRKLADSLRRSGLTVMNMDEEALRLQRAGRSGRAHVPAKPERQESVVWLAAEMITRAIDLPHVGVLAHFGPPAGAEVYVDYVCRLVRLGANLKRVVTLVEGGQRKRMEELFAGTNVEPQITEVQAGEPGESEVEFGARPERRDDRDRGDGRRGGGREDRGPRRERGERGGRDERSERRGRGDRGDRSDRDDRGSRREPLVETLSAAPAGPAIPAAPPKPKAVGPMTSHRDFPAIPLRYTLPVIATPGRRGLPSYPPPKNLGSKFRTARRGSKKGPVEE